MSAIHADSSFRRNYHRLQFNVPATLIIENSQEKSSKIRDLSARGVGVSTDFPLDIHREINIVIKLSGLIEKPVLRHAKVAWCCKVKDNLWQSGLDFGEDNKISFA